jgi:hypothetical protein
VSSDQVGRHVDTFAGSPAAVLVTAVLPSAVLPSADRPPTPLGQVAVSGVFVARGPDPRTGTGAAARSPALSWLELAVAVLAASRQPLRAADIVRGGAELGLTPRSGSRTPAQSLNRDLHQAVAHGERRVGLGPQPGQFQYLDSSPATVAGHPPTGPDPSAISSRTRPGGCPAEEFAELEPGLAGDGGGLPEQRLPVSPLVRAVQLRGGLATLGLTPTAAGRGSDRKFIDRVTRGYHRSKARGWIRVWDADEFAVCVLGQHPAAIWGAQWWAPPEWSDSERPPVNPDTSRDCGGGQPEFVRGNRTQGPLLERGNPTQGPLLERRQLPSRRGCGRPAPRRCSPTASVASAGNPP